MNLQLIISGGQTGADRAGLDFAIANGIEHGGWCPRGRRAEQGQIVPVTYNLTETTADSGYTTRTMWNVRDADGTVIFTLEHRLSGGSLFTQKVAAERGRAWLHISKEKHGESAANSLCDFIRERSIAILNVAGSRESKEPGIYPFVLETLTKALKP